MFVVWVEFFVTILAQVAASLISYGVRDGAGDQTNREFGFFAKEYLCIKKGVLFEVFDYREGQQSVRMEDVNLVPIARKEKSFFLYDIFKNRKDKITEVTDN